MYCICRTESSEGEWWVAYHGTEKVTNLTDIAADGFLVGPRQKYGPGIYSAPGEGRNKY